MVKRIVTTNESSKFKICYSCGKDVWPIHPHNRQILWINRIWFYTCDWCLSYGC